jgi:hypothetical protein
MTDLGTWAWAERTGGRMSRADRWQVVRQGALAQLGRLPSAWRSAIFGERWPYELPAPPDTAIAHTADDRVRELSAPPLYGHCVRTWLFSALFAQRDDVAHDPELLYLACLLHDLGLTDPHDGADPTAACFAVEGARAAQTLLCDHGEPADRARTVAEAISLHLNVEVPARLGPEAHLLSKGVSLDAVGRYFSQIPPAPRQAVLERWPRDGSSAHLAEATLRQAEKRPESRAGLARKLGFQKLVLGNPLDA